MESQYLRAKSCFGRLSPFYLIESFVIPVWINSGQLGGDAVVLSHHNGMKRHEHHLLIDTVVA